MSEAPAIISVYCQLPTDVDPDNLDLSQTNWQWHHVLEFPVSKIEELPVLKPYKWIRYATGIVVGARGDLRIMSETDSSDWVAVNYNSDLSRVSIDLYYHTTDEEKRQMFPIDPNLSKERVLTSSGTSTRRGDFHSRVEDRDGTCVVTGARSYVCDAVHLIPHSKGDMYIERFTAGRRQISNGDEDILRDIDDVRNGLFLNKTMHATLCKDIAFLKIPNFAMNATDIDADADPGQEIFAYHIFDRSTLGSLSSASINSAIRTPSDMSEWPPVVLFDAIYASTVWYHFGIKGAFAKWNDVFSPGGPMTVAQADEKDRRDKSDAGKERSSRQKLEREKRATKREGKSAAMDALDMVMMCRYIGMGPEKTKAYLQHREEMAAEREREMLEDKVNTWRETVV